MRDIYQQLDSAHQELSQLLPWYVNKTLQGSELKQIENHLTVCLTCKRELIQLQKLAYAVNQEGSLDSLEQASFSRLKMRLQTGQPLNLQFVRPQVQIEQPKISAPDYCAGQPGNAAKQGGVSRAVLRPALAIAAVLLLSLLMPRYVETDLQPGNAFRTLSDSHQEPISANEIRVVFAKNVNQQQKNKILERVQGKFTSNNPTAQGVYIVRLHTDIASKQLLEVIEELRKDAAVIFAEPAYALLSSTHTEE
ncbi:MAG: hypothetical protein PHY16_15310 [Methylobacter sp.]|nr:hypothetical protein [Methylobacter sp.]